MKRPHLQIARFFIHVSIALGLTLALVPENNAFATPTTFHIAGYLLDATDTPVSNTVSFQFRLFDVPTGGSSVYDTGSVPLAVLNGNFAYDLGSGSPLDDSLFSSILWLDTTVSARRLSPWMRIFDANDTPDGIFSGGGYKAFFGSAIPPKQPPIANAGGPYFVTAGNAITLDGSASTDPDGDAIVSYLWDINSDGTFDDVSGVTPLLTAAMVNSLGVGNHPIALRVEDSFALTGAAFSSITVASAPAPVPEPSTWMLIGTGLVGLLGYGWRRQQRTV